MTDSVAVAETVTIPPALVWALELVGDCSFEELAAAAAVGDFAGHKGIALLLLGACQQAPSEIMDALACYEVSG